MKVTLVSAALPPQLDGIGDYTALLSAELARQQVEVTVLSGQRANTAPISGVRIVPAFAAAEPASVRALLNTVREERPDWLLVQYNPFAYGKWGYNPYLPLTLRAIRRQVPQTRLAVMFHEAYTPIINWKFAVMTAWQRWQAHTLARAAHRLYFSMELLARQVGGRSPDRPVSVLPVGANIPRLAIDAQEARARLGIRAEQVVLGLFGTAHPSRMLPLMRQAGEAVRREGHDPLILYIGPDDTKVRAVLDGLPLRADGAQPAEEVSRRFAAMDIYLAAFVDGVSTRRGSLMAGLQHGIATVGTHHYNTDNMLRNADGKAYLLAPVDAPDAYVEHVLSLARDPDLRLRIGLEGQRLYEREFDWKPIAARLLADFKAEGRG